MIYYAFVYGSLPGFIIYNNLWNAAIEISAYIPLVIFINHRNFKRSITVAVPLFIRHEVNSLKKSKAEIDRDASRNEYIIPIRDEFSKLIPIRPPHPSSTEISSQSFFTKEGYVGRLLVTYHMSLKAQLGTINSFQTS